MRTAITLTCLIGLTSPALCDELEKAHQLALASRDAYWQCLGTKGARIFQTTTMSPTEFALYVGGICPNEAQRFTVTLVDFLARKFPDVDTDTHMAAAKHAIELAQKNLVTGYIKLHTGQPKQ